MKFDVELKDNSTHGINLAEKIQSVFITRDYSKFRFLEGNRLIGQAHLSSITRSMREIGMLVSPIIINTDHLIIDGQHRFLAAEELGLPLMCIMVADYGLPEVQALNSIAKKWNTMDHLDSFIELKHKSYIALGQLLDIFPEIGITSMINICTNLTGAHGYKEREKRSSNSLSLFKQGGFEMGDVEQATTFMSNLMRLKNTLPLFYNRKSFVMALMVIERSADFDWNVFVKKTKTTPSRYVDNKPHLSRESKQRIEDIYNYKRNKSQLVNFRNL